MTIDPTLPGGDHLDDEALSAVLDGEGAGADAAHVESCDSCSARLGALRDASVLVATPVPPASDDRREASIAAALDALGSEVPATVVPLSRRLPTQWLAAAAALLVVIGAFAFLGSATGDDDDDSASAGDTAAETAGGATSDDAAADQDSTMALSAPATVDGGDLGVIEVGDLRSRVEGGLAARESATETTAAADAAPSAASGAASSNAYDAGTAPCEAEVRATNQQLGALVYRATGTLNDEPVVVLAFSVDADTWVYVVSVDGCSVRNQQTFAS
jgi:hypothetical protein